MASDSIASIPVNTLTVTLTDTTTGDTVTQSATYVIDEMTVTNPGNQTGKVGVPI